MGKEYLSYPGDNYPGDAFPFAAPQVDDDTTVVHSVLGWEWERVQESEVPDYASLVPDLLGATSEVVQSTDVPLSNITIAGDVAKVNTLVVKEIWSKIVTAREGVFEKVTADMISANAITSDKISVGALDGLVITGATIRTAESGASMASGPGAGSASS